MSSSALGRVFGLSQYLPIIPARSKSGTTRRVSPIDSNSRPSNH